MCGEGGLLDRSARTQLHQPPGRSHISAATCPCRHRYQVSHLRFRQLSPFGLTQCVRLCIVKGTEQIDLRQAFKVLPVVTASCRLNSDMPSADDMVCRPFYLEVVHLGNDTGATMHPAKPSP
jgi:hypothetical protein